MNLQTTRWDRFEWPLSGQKFDVSVPEGYSLRTGRFEDLDAMHGLVDIAYASDPSWDGQMADIKKRVGHRMRERISDPDANFVLATLGDRIFGLNGVAVHSPTNMHLITGICVDPAHQGRGLGGVLLGASLSWLRDQGLSTATVTTDATAVAAKVYARFGAIREANVENRNPPRRT